MMANNIVTELNIKSLFSSEKYVIPIYQRNYAWGETEITQLIQDIVDYSLKDNCPNYYIGTLIVFEREKDNICSFETIDGQQRLTTLTILLSAIKNTYSNIADINHWYQLNLEFDSRKVSTETLQSLFYGNKHEYKEYNTAIRQAYNDSIKSLQKTLKESHQSIEAFCEYLLNYVFILRVSVPKDTDLNHYFEIMNSRGEQLEKHEILKAKCLDILNKEGKDLSYAFNLIWEACSNMEKYVQYGFNVSQRDKIFKPNDWNSLEYKTLDEISESLKKETPTNSNEDSLAETIKDLLASKLIEVQTTENEETPDRFNTVINFSNFLLHILRLQTKQNIPLDDKRLIELFEPHLKNSKNVIAFVKEFGYNLLKGKFLFDKYIIKRELLKGEDRWSLKRLKWYEKNKVSYINTFGDENENGHEGENREILMLLSMFHVSAPTLVYKHWLNAALKYVFEHEEIQSNDYKSYLKNLAKSIFDRFIAEEQLDYFEIIYTNNGIYKNTDIDISKLDQGTGVENFVFNYLDYLLWQKDRQEDKPKFESFEYTFRSSVEHYYPQNPIEGNPKIDQKHLDNFGNLCLISSRKNSRLSNFMPQAKKDFYQNSATIGIDSIKQSLMMEFSNWNVSEIESHGKEMKELLLT